MSMVLEQILTEGIAQLSYLVGDDETGVAAVIDPRTDVEIYVELARKHKVSITHIFETHIHADFVSGARELAGRVQTAEVYRPGSADRTSGANHDRRSTKWTTFADRKPAAWPGRLEPLVGHSSVWFFCLLSCSCVLFFVAMSQKTDHRCHRFHRSH